MNVRIKCSERVYFDQVVEMDQEDWEQLKAATPARLEDGAMSPITIHLDLTDVSDSGDFDGISMVVCDASGEPIQPLDECP